MAIRTSRLGVADLTLAKRLFALMAEVFEEPSQELGDDYVTRLLANPAFWVIAAFSDEQLAGGVTAHTLPMTRAESSELFVYDVAVHAAHQRRGVGRQLMQKLRAEAALQGIHELFVPADDEDVHALDFYRAIGGAGAPVTIFTFGRQT